MNDLEILELNELAVQLSKEAEDAKVFLDNALSDSTKHGYASDWNIFTTWCLVRKQESIPARPETVALYISWMAMNGKRVATIQRAMASIAKAHKTDGLPSPTSHEMVRTEFTGIKRTIGVDQDRVDAIGIDELKKIIGQFDSSVEGLRNKALLLIGYMGAFRRSELVAILRKDVKFSDEGVSIKLKKSKTDQKGIGFLKAIPRANDKEFCPVLALADWLLVAPEANIVFCHVEGSRGPTKTGQKLSDKMIARSMQRWCDNVGVDGWFAGHSLRAGFVTAAAKAGKADRDIMRITGHKSHSMIDRYVRVVNVFENNAGKDLL